MVKLRSFALPGQKLSAFKVQEPKEMYLILLVLKLK